MDHKSLKRFCLTASLFLLYTHYWQKRLSTFSLFWMDQILPKLLCMTIFCNSSFSKIKPKASPLAELLQVRSEVAAVRWGRSGRVHGLEFTKKQMMRVERFKAQRNDGVRKTLTLHLLLFLCKQQQHSGQTERAFTFGLLHSVIYLRSDLGAVVRLLLESAAYRLVWTRAWLSGAGLSRSPSDVSKLWSSGEPSLKKSRLRERTVTKRNAQRSTQNHCRFAGRAVF